VGDRQLAEGPLGKSERVRVERAEENAVAAGLNDFLKLGDLLGRGGCAQVLPLRVLGLVA
jgi:hypothetical protein